MTDPLPAAGDRAETIWLSAIRAYCQASHLDQMALDDQISKHFTEDSIAFADAILEAYWQRVKEGTFTEAHSKLPNVPKGTRNFVSP